MWGVGPYNVSALGCKLADSAGIDTTFCAMSVNDVWQDFVQNQQDPSSCFYVCPTNGTRHRNAQYANLVRPFQVGQAFFIVTGGSRNIADNGDHVPKCFLTLS